MACSKQLSDEGKREEAMVTRQLICAICLEGYTKPRGLSCLHTFCEGCIQSCIIKEVEKGTQLTVIKCPVCRNDTAPLDPTEAPVEWVKDLTSKLDLIQVGLETDGRERTPDTPLCDVCMDTPQAAHRFCKQCRQYMCKTCMDLHNRLSGWHKHSMLALVDAKHFLSVDFDLGNVEYCSIHTDKYIELYCEDHTSLCCNTCAIVQHRQCGSVLEVKEMGQRLKTENKDKSLHFIMAMLQSRIRENKSVIQVNMLDVQPQADAMVTKVTDLKNQLVDVLDQIVTKANDTSKQIKKERSKTRDDEISSLESLLAAIASSCKLLESAMKHGTDTQIFIAFHKIEEQVKSYREMVNKDLKGVTPVDLHLPLLNTLTDVTNVLNSVKEVSIHTTERKTNIAEMSKLLLINVQKHPDMEKQPWYTGIAYLPNGQLLTTDRYNYMCCLLDRSCNVVAYVRLPGAPTNLAVIGPSEVVIPLDDTHQLQRVSVEADVLTLNGTISCNNRKPCRVSRVSDKEFAVGWEEGLSIVTLEGTEIIYLDKDFDDRKLNFSYDLGLVWNTKRCCFIQSSYSTKTVYCLGLNGEVTFQYKGTLMEPRGLALDFEGNVYIGDRSLYSKSIHQVSPAGELLRSISLSFRPEALCFNPENGELMVTDHNVKFIQRIRFV